MTRRLPRPVLKGLQLALALVLLAVLWHVADGARAMGLLAQMHPGWLGAALGALTLQTGLSALRWRLAAGQLGIRLGRVEALREYYLAQIVNQTLPGGVLGDAGRAVRSRAQAGLMQAAQAVLFERLAGQVALFAVFAAAAIPALALPGGMDAPRWLAGPMLALIGAGVAAGVVFWWGALWPVKAAARIRQPCILALAAPGIRARQAWLSLGTALCNIAAFLLCARAVGADGAGLGRARPRAADPAQHADPADHRRLGAARGRGGGHPAGRGRHAGRGAGDERRLRHRHGAGRRAGPARDPPAPARRPGEAPMTAPSAAFAIPGDLDSTTGGYIYDRRVIAGLRALGREMHHLPLGARFPDPTRADTDEAARQLAAVPPDRPVIIDGLALGALDPGALRGMAAPMVAMIHHPLALETGLSRARRDHLYRTERANLARAAHVLVPSPRTAEAVMAEYGVAPDRVTIARPGTDRPKGHHRPADPPLILSVGIQVPRKGHDILLRALARLADRPWQAAIVGTAQDPSCAARLGP